MKNLGSLAVSNVGGWIAALGLGCALFCTAAPVRAGDIVLWEQEYEDIQKVLDGVLGDFQKANPGITVKRSHYGNEQLRDQFKTAAMGRGGADVVIAPSDFAGPFSVMGIIKPIDAWAGLERFPAPVVDAVKDAKGKVWGVPFSKGNHLVLFYNKKIVPKAPQTVEELIAMARKESDPAKKKYGFAYNLAEPFWFVTFLGAYGERPLVGVDPKLNTAGMVSALTLVRKLKFDDKIVPGDCDYSCADTLFVEKKVGMIINGDWALQKYRDSLKGDIGVAPLPLLKETGKPMSPMVSGKYFFLNANLKDKKFDDVRKLVDYLTSKPVQEMLVQKTQRLPSLTELGKAKVVTEDPMLSAMEAAMVNGQPMPMAVEMRAVWDAIRPQLQGVMADQKKDIKAAVEIMQKDAVTKIKEMKE